MSGPEWYRVLIYPHTKTEGATISVMAVRGYHWHCERHEKLNCRRCRNYERARMLRVARSKDSWEGSVDEVLLKAFATLFHDRVWRDVDGGFHVFLWDQ